MRKPEVWVKNKYRRKFSEEVGIQKKNVRKKHSGKQHQKKEHQEWRMRLMNIRNRG